MTDLLFDAVARIARHEVQARSWATIGRVTEVHTGVLAGDDHAVSVRLRDSGVIVPRLPVAVGALGFVATPAVGDVVVVVFAEGDPHAGVIVGNLYNRDLAPPPHAAGQLVLRLPPGHSAPDIDVLADPATPEVTLKVGEATVEITGRTATVTIGDAKLAVDGGSPATVTLTSGGARLELSAGGDIVLEADGNLEIKAGGNLSLTGGAKVKVSGAIVEVN